MLYILMVFYVYHGKCLQIRHLYLHYSLADIEKICTEKKFRKKLVLLNWYRNRQNAFVCKRKMLIFEVLMFSNSFIV